MTPFRNGTIDFSSLGKLMSMQSEGGCSAVVVCGTTGEGSVLSPAEHKSIVQFAVSHADKKYPVIAGCGSNDTQKALILSRQAEDCGAAAVLLVTPYYNKTTQKGLIAHYTYIADRINIPVLIYNVPSRTGMTVAPETYAELSQHPNIAGVKEASTDFDAIIKSMSLCGEDFTFYSGNDNLTLPLIALGAKGLISVASNIIPEVMSLLCSLCLSGQFKEARMLNSEYMSLFSALFCEVNPIPVKAALELLGLCSSEARLPLIPLGSANREILVSILKRYGLSDIK